MSKPEDDLPPADLKDAPIEVAPVVPKNRGGRPRKQILTPHGAPAPVKAKAPQVDEPKDETGLLTKAEIDAIRAEARDHVTAELKKSARTKLKDKFIQEERAKNDPKQEMVQVRLDLAEYTEGLLVDGVRYYHNGLYTIPRAKYDVFLEQMYRSHEHQNQIDGKSRADLARRLYRESDSRPITHVGPTGNA